IARPPATAFHPDRLDAPDRLVPRDERQAPCREAPGRYLEIRSADGAGDDAEEEVAWTGCGILDGAQPQRGRLDRARTVEDERSHQASIVALARRRGRLPAGRRCIVVSPTKYCPVNAMLSSGATEVRHRYVVRKTGEGAFEAEGEVIVTGPFARPDIVD